MCAVLQCAPKIIPHFHPGCQLPQFFPSLGPLQRTTLRPSTESPPQICVFAQITSLPPPRKSPFSKFFFHDLWDCHSPPPQIKWSYPSQNFFSCLQQKPGVRKLFSCFFLSPDAVCRNKRNLFPNFPTTHPLQSFARRSPTLISSRTFRWPIAGDLPFPSNPPPRSRNLPIVVEGGSPA